MDNLNPDSLKTLTGCKLERSLETAGPETIYQFERLGYFCRDSKDSRPDSPVFNRTVTLRDAWAKIAEKQPPQKPVNPNKKNRAENKA